MQPRQSRISSSRHAKFFDLTYVTISFYKDSFVYSYRSLWIVPFAVRHNTFARLMMEPFFSDKRRTPQYDKNSNPWSYLFWWKYTHSISVVFHSQAHFLQHALPVIQGITTASTLTMFYTFGYEFLPSFLVFPPRFRLIQLSVFLTPSVVLWHLQQM